MASIQKLTNKKGTTYRALIRKKGLKPISKTFPTKKLAKQFALSIESDRKAQLAFGGLSNTITFKYALEEYLSSRYKNSQYRDYRMDYWKKLIGNRCLVDINKNDIINGLRLLPKSLSNSTINKYKAAASVVFSYACREYDLPDNPVRNILSLPEPRGIVRFLSDTERARLFKACRASQWSKLYLLVLMAITTGARKGELIGLEWSDIDFDRNLAYIKTTKNGEPKVLPLTEDVIIELGRFKEQKPLLVFNSEIVTDKPFCFTKPWKKALKQAEIDNFRFHDLRHTCASYLAQNGASLLEIADVLGHKQIQMTKRYAHLCVDHKQKLINRVMNDMLV